MAAMTWVITVYQPGADVAERPTPVWTETALSMEDAARRADILSGKGWVVTITRR